VRVDEPQDLPKRGYVGPEELGEREAAAARKEEGHKEEERSCREEAASAE